MAKLTQTELKVLANEIANRISAVITEKENKIKNQKEYINFENNFDKSDIGKRFDEVLNKMISLETVMTRNGFLKDSNSYYSSMSPQSKRFIEVKKSYIKYIKDKEFPMPKLDLGEIKRNSWNTYSMSPYDYALHQLNLKQLTNNSDIEEVLNEIVKDLSNKIK